MIEDRLVNLDINSALTQNYVRAIAGLEPVSKLPQKSDRGWYHQADQLMAVSNPVELIKALDSVRRGLDAKNAAASDNSEDTAFVGLPKEDSDSLIDLMKYGYRKAEEAKMNLTGAKYDSFNDKRNKFYTRMDTFHNLVNGAVNKNSGAIVESLNKELKACEQQNSDQEKMIATWKASTEIIPKLLTKASPDLFQSIWDFDNQHWLSEYIGPKLQVSTRNASEWHKDNLGNPKIYEAQYQAFVGFQKFFSDRKAFYVETLKTQSDVAHGTQGSTEERLKALNVWRSIKKQSDDFDKSIPNSTELASSFLSVNYGYSVANAAINEKKMSVLELLQNSEKICKTEGFKSGTTFLRIELKLNDCQAGIAAYAKSQKDALDAEFPYVRNLKADAWDQDNCAFAQRASAGLKVAQGHATEFREKMLAVTEPSVVENTSAMHDARSGTVPPKGN